MRRVWYHIVSITPYGNKRDTLLIEALLPQNADECEAAVHLSQVQHGFVVEFDGR